MRALPLPLFAKCVLHACLAFALHSFREYYYGHSFRPAPAQPPQLHRISMVERQQHIAPHALGPAGRIVHTALD
jgi:hypothetical protein